MDGTGKKDGTRENEIIREIADWLQCKEKEVIGAYENALKLPVERLTPGMPQSLGNAASLQRLCDYEESENGLAFRIVFKNDTDLVFYRSKLLTRTVQVGRVKTNEIYKIFAKKLHIEGRRQGVLVGTDGRRGQSMLGSFETRAGKS